MPKRQKPYIFSATDNGISADNIVEETPKEVTINSERISIQSLYPAHLRYTGRVSGQLYSWAKAGDVVSVLKEDAQELLAKRINAQPCCGQSGEGNFLFKTVQ